MLKPLNSYLLVEVETEEQKTSGGLYMPQTVTNDPTCFLKKGIVKAVNKDCTDVKVGDTILFNKNAIAAVPESKSLKLVRVEDTYGIC